jgi:hypothetical protein
VNIYITYDNVMIISNTLDSYILNILLKFVPFFFFVNTNSFHTGDVNEIFIIVVL